jgi:outer membrane lipoprotein SlyB
VEAVVPVQSKGQGTGIGAVTGGVLGAVVGNQFGGGNGKKAMAVLGAVGGGFAGNEVEKNVRSTTAYDVRVRMDDGSTRSVRREQRAAVGTRVVLKDNTF